MLVLSPAPVVYTTPRVYKTSTPLLTRLTQAAITFKDHCNNSPLKGKKSTLDVLVVNLTEKSTKQLNSAEIYHDYPLPMAVCKQAMLRIM